jgi:hypothetical protein
VYQLVRLLAPAMASETVPAMVPAMVLAMAPRLVQVYCRRSSNQTNTRRLLGNHQQLHKDRVVYISRDPIQKEAQACECEYVDAVNDKEATANLRHSPHPCRNLLDTFLEDLPESCNFLSARP